MLPSETTVLTPEEEEALLAQQAAAVPSPLAIAAVPSTAAVGGLLGAAGGDAPPPPPPVSGAVAPVPVQTGPEGQAAQVAGAAPGVAPAVTNQAPYDPALMGDEGTAPSVPPPPPPATGLGAVQIAPSTVTPQIAREVAGDAPPPPAGGYRVGADAVAEPLMAGAASAPTPSASGYYGGLRSSEFADSMIPGRTRSDVIYPAEAPSGGSPLDAVGAALGGARTTLSGLVDTDPAANRRAVGDLFLPLMQDAAGSALGRDTRRIPNYREPRGEGIPNYRVPYRQADEVPKDFSAEKLMEETDAAYGRPWSERNLLEEMGGAGLGMLDWARDNLITPADVTTVGQGALARPPAGAPPVAPAQEPNVIDAAVRGAPGLWDQFSQRFITQPDTDVARMQSLTERAPPDPSGVIGTGVPLPPPPPGGPGANSTFRSNLSTESGVPETAGPQSIGDQLGALIAPVTAEAQRRADEMGATRAAADYIRNPPGWSDVGQWLQDRGGEFVANGQDTSVNLPGGPYDIAPALDAVRGILAGGTPAAPGAVEPAGTAPAAGLTKTTTKSGREVWLDANKKPAFIRDPATGRVEKVIPGESPEATLARLNVGGTAVPVPGAAVAPAVATPTVPAPAGAPPVAPSGQSVAPASGTGGRVGGGNGTATGGQTGISGGRSDYGGGARETGRPSSSGGGSRGGRGFDEGEEDRDFTADDFMEQAGGNRTRAQMLANMANARKRRGRMRNVPRQQESATRANILRALEEAFSGTRPRR